MYADGRLIWLQERADRPEAANRWSSGLVEQRLTPEGVELLRSEIVSTGLFGHDHPPLGSNPPHRVIQVRIGDQLVRVGISFFERRLIERLEDPEAWLPASAWANSQIKAYVPSRYAILYGGLPQTIERSRIFSLLPAPAVDLLRAHEVAPQLGYIGGLTKTSFTYYVSDLTTEEARAFAQALDDAGLKQFLPAGQLDTAPKLPARASIHLCLRRAQPKARSSSRSSPTSPTARASACRVGSRRQKERLDRSRDESTSGIGLLRDVVSWRLADVRRADRDCRDRGLRSFATHGERDTDRLQPHACQNVPSCRWGELDRPHPRQDRRPHRHGVHVSGRDERSRLCVRAQSSRVADAANDGPKRAQRFLGELDVPYRRRARHNAPPAKRIRNVLALPRAPGRRRAALLPLGTAHTSSLTVGWGPGRRPQPTGRGTAC